MIERLDKDFLDISAVDLAFLQRAQDLRIRCVFLEIIHDLGDAAQSRDRLKLLRLEQLGLHCPDLCHDPAVSK